MALTTPEVELLRDRCRSLPPAEGDYRIDDFLTNVVVTVVDFQMHTTAVAKAMDHFVRVTRLSLSTLDDLEGILDQYRDDQEGNTALALHLWGYRMWTRAHILRGLVAFFAEEGVTTQQDLRAWANRASFRADFEGRVKGLGPAVFNWLVMRQGVETVKPDVHVLRFAEVAIGRRAPDQDVVDALTTIAVDLGIKAYQLDWAIWEHQRSGAAPGLSEHREPTSDRGPSEPSRVGPASLGSGGLNERADMWEIVTFIDDDTGYLAWITAHPDGYVVNTHRTRTQSYLILHRSQCHTISGRPARGTTWTEGAYSKVCSGDRSALVGWLERSLGIAPQPCGTCAP